MTESELGFIRLTMVDGGIFIHVRCSKIQTVQRINDETIGWHTSISLDGMDEKRLIVKETPEEIFRKFI